MKKTQKIFYEEIEKAKAQCKNQDPLIIMGDFNAKIGQRGDEHSVGMQGTGNRNERGERLVRLGINLVNDRLVRLVMPTLIHCGEETYRGI